MSMKDDTGKGKTFFEWEEDMDITPQGEWVGGHDNHLEEITFKSSEVGPIIDPSRFVEIIYLDEHGKETHRERFGGEPDEEIH